jgi:hypothetical protein
MRDSGHSDPCRPRHRSRQRPGQSAMPGLPNRVGIRTGEGTPSFLVRWPARPDAPGRSSSSQHVSVTVMEGNPPQSQLLLTPTSGPLTTASLGRRGTSDTTLIGRFRVIWTQVTERTGPRPPILGADNREGIFARGQRQGIAAPVGIAANDRPKFDSHRYFSSIQQRFPYLTLPAESKNHASQHVRNG